VARVKWVLRFSCVALATAAAAARDARAQEPEAPTEELPSSVRAHTRDRSEGTDPIRGSTLLFEQSMTTQSADVGDTPQSYVPLYELWLSFRPRYWFNEHLSARARFDYTKELTNDQTTTLYRQDIIGDLWVDGVYSAKLDGLWKGTKVDAGLRTLWPTSLASQAAGVYVTVGPLAGVSHRFEINGDGARWLNDAHVSLRGSYLHVLSNATTPTDYASFTYTRQNADGFSFVSDQVSGQTLVRDLVQLVAEAGLQVNPRLSMSVFAVLFNQWHDSPTATAVLTATGPVVPVSSTPVGGSDQQFSQKAWLVASVDYDVLDELELSIGYYNLANAIAPDGATRGLFGSDTIWWSPDARFFLSATANLDVLYEDVTKRSGAPASVQSARAAP
jgi:hypothetical protein